MRNGPFAVSLFSLLLILLPSCSTGSTKSDTCTLAYCQSGATVSLLVNLPPDEMLHANIVACRNDACSSGAPTSVPSADGDKLLIRLQGGVTVLAYVSTHAFSPTLAGYQLDTVFSIEDDAKDGDVYSVTVENGGAPAASAKESVTYTASTPNGAACPPTCHNATIDKTL
jgi:hypothetical protein